MTVCDSIQAIRDGYMWVRKSHRFFGVLSGKVIRCTELGFFLHSGMLM